MKTIQTTRRTDSITSKDGMEALAVYSEFAMMWPTDRGKIREFFNNKHWEPDVPETEAQLKDNSKTTIFAAENAEGEIL